MHAVEAREVVHHIEAEEVEDDEGGAAVHKRVEAHRQRQGQRTYSHSCGQQAQLHGPRWSCQEEVEQPQGKPQNG